MEREFSRFLKYKTEKETGGPIDRKNMNKCMKEQNFI